MLTKDVLLSATLHSYVDSGSHTYIEAVALSNGKHPDCGLSFR